MNFNLKLFKYEYRMELPLQDEVSPGIWSTIAIWSIVTIVMTKGIFKSDAYHRKIRR
jgi:hypothetical protein